MRAPSDQNWIARALAQGGVKAIAFTVVKLALPFIGAGMTVVAGYFSEVPIAWMWIIMASCLSFAGVSAGLLCFGQLRERTRVKDKLAFSGIRVGRNIRGPGLFVGVALKSQASVPIEFQLKRIRTRIGKYSPEQARFAKMNITLPALGEGYFDDHIIIVDNPPKPGALEGFAEFDIQYGHPGALKHTLSIKRRVLVAFNEAGDLLRWSFDEAIEDPS